MSSPSPTVSVALATYNGERFLRRQLESLAKQALPPLELIVSDDGSTDRTLELVAGFANSAPFPVRVFRNSGTLGYRRNFMRAAEYCIGDLIAFCDQDDIWAGEKLKRMVEEFSDPDVLLAYHNARLMDERGRIGGLVLSRHEAGGKFSYQEVEPWKIIPGFSQVIRRNLLQYNHLHAGSIDIFDLDECMPHDQWFLFLASALGKTSSVAEPLAFYRMHGNNTSGWLPAKPLAYALHNIAYASYYVRTSNRALQNRIELLQRLKQDLSARDAAHIDDVLAHHALISEHVRRRFALYTEKSLLVRLRLLASLIRNRSYGDTRIKFGSGRLLLDTVIGVPVGHRLR